MRKKQLHVLDLFCCSGGSAEGAMRIGAKVTGIDIRRPSSYPGKFILKDVRELDAAYLSKFDFVMSSPPCQAFSRACAVARNFGKEYPDFVCLTRELIIGSSKPGFIENVPSALIKNDLTLCGTMFDLKDTTGKQLIRHRRFELINWNTPFVTHDCTDVDSDNIITVVGSDYNQKEHGRQAMGLSTSTRLRWEINQAVPPTYSQFILNRWLNVLTIQRNMLNLTIRHLCRNNETRDHSRVPYAV